MTAGQNVILDVNLKVASKGEQVVVTTEAPTIEPTKTEISQVMDTQQIESLPVMTLPFNPAFGSPRTMFNPRFNPRQFQFCAKLQF
jgi:hypothetical protein